MLVFIPLIDHSLTFILQQIFSIPPQNLMIISLKLIPNLMILMKQMTLMMVELFLIQIHRMMLSLIILHYLRVFVQVVDLNSRLFIEVQMISSQEIDVLFLVLVKLSETTLPLLRWTQSKSAVSPKLKTWCFLHQSFSLLQSDQAMRTMIGLGLPQQMRQ